MADWLVSCRVFAAQRHLGPRPVAHAWAHAHVHMHGPCRTCMGTAVADLVCLLPSSGVSLDSLHFSHLSSAEPCLLRQFMSTAVADLVSTISGTRPQAEPPNARLASELLGEAAR